MSFHTPLNEKLTRHCLLFYTRFFSSHNIGASTFSCVPWNIPQHSVQELVTSHRPSWYPSDCVVRWGTNLRTYVNARSIQEHGKKLIHTKNLVIHTSSFFTTSLNSRFILWTAILAIATDIWHKTFHQKNLKTFILTF